MATYEKMLLDLLYESVLIVGISSGLIFVSKKYLSMKPPLQQMDITDMVKTTAYIATSIKIKDYAIEKGWIPASLMPKS